MTTSATLASRFRSEMRDIAEPYLWTDADLIRYMNQARLEICQRAWGISDIIELVFTGVALVQLPHYVTKVKAAYFADTGKSVTLRSYTELSNPFTVRTGQHVQCLLTGIMEGALRAYPPPVDPVTIRLVVLRNPKDDFTAVDGVQDSELPTDANTGILYWMRHEAYSKEDSETFDRGQADYFYNKFIAFVDGYKHMHERRETQAHVVRMPSGGYW